MRLAEREQTPPTSVNKSNSHVILAWYWRKNTSHSLSLSLSLSTPLRHANYLRVRFSRHQDPLMIAFVSRLYDLRYHSRSRTTKRRTAVTILTAVYLNAKPASFTETSVPKTLATTSLRSRHCKRRISLTTIRSTQVWAKNRAEVDRNPAITVTLKVSDLHHLRGLSPSFALSSFQKSTEPVGALPPLPPPPPAASTSFLLSLKSLLPFAFLVLVAFFSGVAAGFSSLSLPVVS